MKHLYETYLMLNTEYCLNLCFILITAQESLVSEFNVGISMFGITCNFGKCPCIVENVNGLHLLYNWHGT
jgi:hypothetical protein